MNFSDAIINDIANTCISTPVKQNHKLLLQKISQIIPTLSFDHVLTRGGWHRTGGVVDSKGKHISDNLRDWVEKESNGEVNQLIDIYLDSGYIVTSYIGKTHYFVAKTGEAAADFVQLEIEELQEVQDHPLFNNEVLPDDIEDIIEPLDAEKLTQKQVDDPRYVFRRITSVDSFIRTMSTRILERGHKFNALQRFMQDWDRSSSKETGPFCHHWVLTIQEYTDAWGEPIMHAKPVSTLTKELPLMELNGVHRGSRLATLIHGFDHDVGYPMAWYFYMLSHTEVPHKLAEAIHNDLMGAYDYLPARDLKVLNEWYVKPYGI